MCCGGCCCDLVLHEENRIELNHLDKPVKCCNSFVCLCSISERGRMKSFPSAVKHGAGSVPLCSCHVTPNMSFWKKTSHHQSSSSSSSVDLPQAYLEIHQDLVADEALEYFRVSTVEAWLTSCIENLWFGFEEGCDRTGSLFQWGMVWDS